MLHLRLRLLPLLRAASQPTTTTTPALPSSLHHLLLSTSTTTTPFFVEDYLVATCGLTAAQAARASKDLPYLYSPSNPDAVLALLSAAGGLTRPDIATVVAADPTLLLARVDDLAPRLAALRDCLGLSYPQIARFLLVGGCRAVHHCDVAPKLDFWIPFFGSLDRLLHAMEWNNSILAADVETMAKPNIALLRDEWGLSVYDIVQLLNSGSKVLASKPEIVREFLRRAERLGVPRSSTTFMYTVKNSCDFNDEVIAAKMEFLSNILGCSMEKVRAAVCKYPNVLGVSEEYLQRKIQFLVAEVGLEPEYILEWPGALTNSLEKRMMPRHYVLTILRAKGLLTRDVCFLQLVRLKEPRFIAEYIDCHKDTLPGLAYTYSAACAGEIPSDLHLCMESSKVHPISEAN